MIHQQVLGRATLEAWQAALCQTRWYRDKSLTLTSLECVAEVSLTEVVQLTVLRLGYSAGESALYAFPTAQSADLAQVHLPNVNTECAYADALYRLVREQKTAQGPSARIAGKLARGPVSPERSATPLKVQMSSVAFRMGEASLLKVQRRLTVGRSHEAALLTALELEGSFRDTPRLLGELELRLDSGECASLALLLSWIDHDGDFFSWATEHDFLAKLRDDALERYAALGAHTARLHQALRQVPLAGFAPHLSDQGDQQHFDVETRTWRVLTQLQNSDLSLLGAGRQLAELLLAERETLLQTARHAILPNGTPLQQVHGDYHLGQVLLTKDGLAVVDFEGDPALPLTERERPRSPWVDVAGILRSIDYAAHIARDRATRANPEKTMHQHFSERAHAYQAAFLRGYEQETGQTADDKLVRSHLLDKALAELSYELSARPDWAHIPLSGLLELLDLPQ